jgi:hypothetical protein
LAAGPGSGAVSQPTCAKTTRGIISIKTNTHRRRRGSKKVSRHDTTPIFFRDGDEPKFIPQA